MIKGLGGNVGVLATGDGTVLVDTMTLEAQGAAIRETAEALTGEPVVMIINTHYHLDHTHGNPTQRQARSSNHHRVAPHPVIPPNHTLKRLTLAPEGWNPPEISRETRRVLKQVEEAGGLDAAGAAELVNVLTKAVREDQILLDTQMAAGRRLATVRSVF